jgi:hypothetical protein
MQRLVKLVLLVALVGGCGGPKSAAPQRESNLTLYDKAGEPIARAYVDLPGAPPDIGGVFEGECELLWFAEGFPSEAIESGRYRADVYAEKIAFDLNEGWADNNVVLFGSFEGSELRGRWMHATIAGGADRGEAVLQWEVEQ